MSQKYEEIVVKRYLGFHITSFSDKSNQTLHSKNKKAERWNELKGVTGNVW